MKSSQEDGSTSHNHFGQYHLDNQAETSNKEGTEGQKEERKKSGWAYWG